MKFNPNVLSKEDKIIMKYENEILELIENQMRNDENTLTNSDMQGVAQAIVMKIYEEGRKNG